MKIALITGGARGIGAETVKKFAKEQYTVILNYRNSRVQAEQLQRELVQGGCDVHLYCADVSDVKQVSEMFAWVGRYFKKLDVLVNNAGVALTKQLQDVTESEFTHVINTNAKATFFCCQQAMPLLKNSERGAIVNVSSIWGVEGASCESVYSMSKFAIVGLTKSLAEELQPLNITVNCVCPPIVLTDMCKHLTKQDIDEFCAEHNVKAYSPSEVASDIYSLSQSGNTGIIFKEK
ncbi:MAG: SDR family oxidoreductase [Clostridiales bacterium]|nr:SDR family oxidoreductase [Clostridiales bacterium]